MITIYSESVPNDSREAVTLLNNCCAFEQLFQINNSLQCKLGHARLDLFSCKVVDVKVADELLLPYDFQHQAITVSIQISDKPNKLEYNTFYYDLKKANYDALNSFFHSVNWVISYVI